MTVTELKTIAALMDDMTSKIDPRLEDFPEVSLSTETFCAVTFLLYVNI